MAGVRSMTDEEWLNELKGSLRRVKPHDEESIDQLTLDSTLDWAEDSLTVVEAILDLEERLNVDIPDKALPFTSAELSALTMQQFITQLRSHVR